jgi:hypothetical protein
MEQRGRFIRDHRVGLYTMAELCARYAVSRKTGYKWRARFDDAGRPGLQDRSQAPQDRSGFRRGDLSRTPAASELGTCEALGVAGASGPGADYIIRTWMCYPCCRFTVLPMFPVAHVCLFDLLECFVNPFALRPCRNTVG